MIILRLFGLLKIRHQSPNYALNHEWSLLMRYYW